MTKERDLDEMVELLGKMRSLCKDTVNASVISDDVGKTAEVWEHNIDILHQRFEKVAQRLMGEKRTAFETRQSFFERVSALPIEELLAKIQRNGA